MKLTGKRVAQSAATTALVLGVSFFSSAQAQTVPKELSDAAEAACKASATSKGFEVAGIASVTPKAGATDAVNVVLNLTKGGQPYKLTCGYTKAAGATVGGTTASPSPAVTTTPAAIASPSPVATPSPVVTPTPTPTAAAPVTTERTGISPWWWLLVPLIGIPLLWWLLRSKDEETTPARSYSEPAREAARTTTTTTPSTYTATEGIIRSGGDVINVYSGPGTTYQVTRTLHDGDRVRLTGRTDSTWVELADGGWIPRANVGTV